MNKHSVWLLSLLSIMLFLAGCGQSSTRNDSSNGTAVTPSNPPEKTAGTTYSIQHAMGETKITGKPSRVVVLTNEGTEVLLSLGIKPVGAVKSWSGSPFYDHIKKDLEGVEVVGDENQPNLEAIAKLKPDLIIGNKLRQEKVYAQLSAIAPTVFSEKINADWQKNFKLYAEALNKKAEGDQLLAKLDQRIAEFKSKAGDKLNMKVSLVRFIPGKTRLYYNDTFAGLMLKKIGFQRPQAQNKETFADEINKERIPDMEGDILFYYTWDNDKQEASAVEKEWIGDPLWKNLNVVKSGNVHRVSDDIWNSSGSIISANLMLDDLEKIVLKK
ncbi:ABC transporter substrate-binding protein [Paenibacillus sp. OAS669]|uniref:ABC transporter substrate-binding protein n=1 Tax=Paenibacillus sp. OAS669 TaxID=2663821 RepID=UPI00178A556F|nr:iron-siderophore ABC transporter substrate-binding protein [Paenibacillus sp. OAS669]